MKRLFLSLATIALLNGACSSGSNSQPIGLKEEKVDPKILNEEQEDNSAYKDFCKSLKLPSGPELYYCFKDFHVNTGPDNIIYFLHGVNGKASDMMPFVSGQSPFYELIRRTDYRTPAILNINPFNPTEVESYVERNSNYIDPLLVNGMISSLKAKLVTEANWQLRNPIDSAKKGVFNKLPIFVSTGTQDEDGFIEGAAIG